MRPATRASTSRATSLPSAALPARAGPGWQARPSFALLLRLVAWCSPIAVSVAVVYGASRALPPPEGHGLRYVEWWLALSATATVALVAAGRLVRRLLPLAALMRLSLVFPDGAPSRFRMALRSGTTATLEERLAHARGLSAEGTPAESAQLLLELVALLDVHDRLTRGHSERVRAYAQSIGRELGLGRHELDLLNWAALLHDVGKLDVPREILTRAGRPTDAEWDVIRGHPAAGARIAEPLCEWLGEWGLAIEEHHERWDGEGYPRGLAGPAISLAGRIVAVADVYDVMTSSRSYRDAGSFAEARQELARCAGTQFDPTVVRAFLGISIRSRRLVSGPLAWLAHAPVLARIPLSPAAGAASAAAVAVAIPVASVPTAEPAASPVPVRSAPAVVHRSVALSPSVSGPTSRAVPSARAGAARSPGPMRAPAPAATPARAIAVPEVSGPPVEPPVTRPAPPEDAGTASSVETTSHPAMTPVVPPAAAGVPVPPVPARPTGDVLAPMKDPLAPVTEAVPPLVEDVPAPVQDILTRADPQAPAGDSPAPDQGALAPGLGRGSLLPSQPPPKPGWSAAS
jgi:putative nucleotidyltransferase with HDIG domain